MISDMEDVSGTLYLQQINLVVAWLSSYIRGSAHMCWLSEALGVQGTVELALLCEFPDLCRKKEGIISPLNSGVK